MKLSELIRNRDVATVTVATIATVDTKFPPSVAEVASVSVTTEPDGKPETLRDLVLEVMVLAGESQADWHYHVDLALADPVDAMTCYTSLKRELQPR